MFGCHACILQIEIGLIELGLRLLQRRSRTFELRLERLDAKLGGAQRSFRPGCIGLLRLLVGMGLLLALDSAGAFLHQILGTRLFLFSEFQLGFGLIERGLRLVDLQTLAVDLGLDVVNMASATAACALAWLTAMT